MKRWDRLVDQYMEDYEAAGKTAETIKATRRELERWGSWMKNLRPRPALEEVNADLIIRYLRGRAAYRAKATLSGTMCKLRCLGEFLVREGVWLSNPLRWLRGPKRDIRSRLPRRISPEVMRGLWEAAATSRYDYYRSVWVTLLSIFYGTGMRRGDVCRLNVSDWCREEGLLLVRNSKTGQERQVSVPALTWQCLEAYLPKRQNHLEALGRSDESALFVNHYGGRLTASAIGQPSRSRFWQGHGILAAVTPA
jgi:site-specific recombinase XerD